MRMRTGLAAWPSAVVTTSTIPARLHGTSTVTSSNPGNGRPPRNIALARLVPRSARAFRPMSRDYLHGIGMQKSAGLRAGAPRDDGGQRLSDYRQNRGGVGPCAPPQNRAVSGAPSRGLAPRRSRGPAAPGGDRQKAYAASGFHDGYEWLKGDLAVTIEASEKGRVGEICGCFGRVRRGDWVRKQRASDDAEYDRSPTEPAWGRPAATSSSARPPETGVRTPLRRDRPQYRRFPGERVRDTACEACEWPP